MGAGQAVLDAVTVVLDVFEHASAQCLATSNDGIPATSGAHLLGREVRVCTGTVPVTLDRLRGPGDLNFEVFGNTLEQPTSNPHLVADRQRVEHANLELPLAHHDFGVGTFNAKAGGEAGLGVSLNNVTAGHLRATDTAVVRALRGGEANFGPAVGTAVLEEGVLLLDAELGLERGVGLGRNRRRVTGVGRVRGHVSIQDFAQNQDVAS